MSISITTLRFHISSGIINLIGKIYMKKITFKEYLESKEELKCALGNLPVESKTYTILKYCKLPVGKSRDTFEHITLKPKQQIIVECRYDGGDTPTVIGITFKRLDITTSDKEHNVLLSASRLTSWLKRNTII